MSNSQWVRWSSAWELSEEKLPNGFWLAEFRRPKGWRGRKQHGFYVTTAPFSYQPSTMIEKSMLLDVDWDPMMSLCIRYELLKKYGAEHVSSEDGSVRGAGAEDSSDRGSLD